MLLGLGFAGAASCVFAADNVNGNLITFNDNGMWCWYQDERAIIDPVTGKLLVGSITSSNESAISGGKGLLATYDLNSGRRDRFTLWNTGLTEDDHDVPALIILPNGKYLAMTSKHGSTSMGDQYTRYRVSTNPHDSSSWGSEQTFDWYTVPGWNTAPAANNRPSYHNLYYLSAEDQVYNFTRGTHQSANSLLFDYTDNSVQWGGQLSTNSVGGYSTGYFKYASNGVDRIYFLATETHPRGFNNNIYMGYISGGKSYDMDGTERDANIFDNVETGGPTAVPDITTFSKIFQSDPKPGSLYSNAWTTDLSLGPDGNPCGLFTARWNDDDPTGNGDPYGSTNEKDNNGYYHHTMFYARYDGATWHVNPVAKMGKLLTVAEEDYTGLGAINPSDPNTIYISTPLDPRNSGDPPLTPGGPTPSPSPSDYYWTPTYQVLDGPHEIYKGVTTDYGQTWTWTPITENSTVDNLRPIVPTWDDGHTAVLWFRGTYNWAMDTDAAVVGVIEQNDTETDLVTYVDANTSNTTRASGTGSWYTGPSSSEGTSDGKWHWRTGVGNNGDVLASNASTTTTLENAPELRTRLTGLDDGAYDIFAYFWANPSLDWQMQAGLDASNLLVFRDNGTQQAEADQFDASVLLSSGGASLYRAYLGRADVLAGSAIDVFIDDCSYRGTESTTGANRTWYDGVGYALVSAIIEGLAGDYNEDGIVDAADYTVWCDHFGTTYALPNRDPENEGALNEADYAYWKANFGNSSSGSGGLAAVPEPGTGAMLVLAALAVRLVGRRKALIR